MNELTREPVMTIKEVSEILKVSRDLIENKVNEFFPEIIQHGKTTYLNEIQITKIKMEIERNSYFRHLSEVKTDYEKEIFINQAMKWQEEKVRKLEEINKQQNQRIGLLIHNQKTYTSTEIAKELNMKSATVLNKKLSEKDIQYKINDTWVLSAQYSGMDYESIKQEELENGVIIYNRHWTGKGRDFILNLFKGENI